MEQNSVNWREFDSFSAQSITLANQIIYDIQDLLSIQDKVIVSVPGGSTPGLFLEALSQAELDWSRVFIVMNDERWVPLGDPKSNEAMLRHAFKSAEGAQVVPFFKQDLSAADAIAEFNGSSADLLSLDICVLGMGEDGHTASLFPGMDQLMSALDSASKPALIESIVPNKELRVSLNLSAILSAKKHYLLIAGNVKKSVLHQASAGKNRQWPISYVATATRLNVFYSNKTPFSVQS